MKDFPHLKLILMSATIQSQLIMSYFSPCPLVSVSGRAFSVEEYYIDDVHSLVRSGQLIQAGTPLLSDPNPHLRIATSLYKRRFYPNSQR